MNKLKIFFLVAACWLTVPIWPSPARADIWRKWVEGYADCIIPNPFTIYPPTIRVFRLHAKVQWDFDTTTHEVLRNKNHKIINKIWFTDRNTFLFHDTGTNDPGNLDEFHSARGYQHGGFWTQRGRVVQIGQLGGYGPLEWTPRAFWKLYYDGTFVKDIKCK